MGDQPVVEKVTAGHVVADTFAGRIHAERDNSASVTPLGQMPFFIEFVKQGGLPLFRAWDDGKNSSTPTGRTDRPPLIRTACGGVNYKNQMKRLIDTARADGLTPAYCFYVASDWLSWNPAWSISEQSRTGCLIGHAEQVRQAQSNRLPDLHHLLMPWHFLVCPSATRARATRPTSGAAVTCAVAVRRAPLPGPYLDSG